MTQTNGPRALAEADIANLCGKTIFDRAVRYYKNGFVLNPRLEGLTLRAEVMGSASKPYQCAATITPAEISVQCDCPFDYGICKHVGALLLEWTFHPERFTRADVRADREVYPYVDDGSLHSYDGEDDIPLQTEDGASEQDEPSPEAEMARLLELRTVQELRQIAQRRDIPLRGTAKADIVAQVAAGLLDAGRLRAAIAQLTPDEVMLLDLVHLVAEQVLVPDSHIARAAARLQATLSGEPKAMLRDLRDRGMLASGARGSYDEHGYRVPEAVVALLPPADYLVAQTVSDSAEVASAASRGSAPRGRFDETLYLLWRQCADRDVKPRPIGGRWLLENTNERLRDWHNAPNEIARLHNDVGWQYRNDLPLTALPPPPIVDDTSLADLERVATGGDRDAAEFGVHLLRRLRLLSGKESFKVHEDAAHALLRQAPECRLRAIFDAWLSLDSWSELTLVLRHDGSLRMRRHAGGYQVCRPKDVQQRLISARRFLVHLLNRLREGVWYSVPALLDGLRRLAGTTLTDPNLWQDGGRPLWWLEWEGGHRLDPRKPAEWAAGYGRFFVEALRGPLTWLGVSTVWGDAFRIEGLRSVLAGKPTGVGSAEAITLHEDLTVGVPPGSDLRVHEFLMTIAEVGEATPAGLTYRITADRISARFAQGQGAPEILAFLAKESNGKVPPKLAATIEGWFARYGDLHLYENLTMIELADDYALPELLATTSLPSHLIYQFSPRLIALDAETTDRFVEELARRGHTPKVEEAVE